MYLLQSATPALIGRDSSVGIATRYGLDGAKSESVDRSGRAV